MKILFDEFNCRVITEYDVFNFFYTDSDLSDCPNSVIHNVVELFNSVKKR